MKKIFLLLFLFSIATGIKSQSCIGCTFNVTNSDTSSVVLGPGETLCIDSTGIFAGKITLSGGAVCNNGVFSPGSLIFNSGTLTNNGNVSLLSNLTLTSSTTINNTLGSVTNLKTLVLNTGSSITNNGVLNISQSLQNNGSIVNNCVVNCPLITGSGSLLNNAIINN
jgi:hypothetical protein